MTQEGHPRRLGCPSFVSPGGGGASYHPSMPTALLTGFGPFLGVTDNPSGALALDLAASPPAGLDLRSTVLPVTFAGVPDALSSFVDEHEAAGPALLLSMGVHRGPGFRLERRARQAPTSDRPDQAGGGGSGHAADRERVTTLDLDELAARLTPAAAEAGGLSVSDDAGSYVCDWTYQHLLQHAERLGVPALFLHVPPIDQVAVADQRPVVERLLELLLASPG